MLKNIVEQKAYNHKFSKGDNNCNYYYVNTNN